VRTTVNNEPDLTAAAVVARRVLDPRSQLAGQEAVGPSWTQAATTVWPFVVWPFACRIVPFKTAANSPPTTSPKNITTSGTR